MQIVSTPQALRSSLEALRRGGQGIGLVPTMGALHEGHMALLTRARADGFAPVVSIFVNPAQFGPNEDFSRYPRAVDEDTALLEAHGASLLYLPSVDGIYPDGFATAVTVGGVTEHLCGPFRPGHFAGVATVVAKLLNQAMPDAAYFGEKDWQQLQVIRRLAADLDMNVRIVGVPTVREADGLALSSRNRYLSEEDRKAAAIIPATLRALAAALAANGDASALLAAARQRLTEAGFVLDYLELADAATCVPSTDRAQSLRLFVAARKGGTRLIDNWPVITG